MYTYGLLKFCITAHYILFNIQPIQMLKLDSGIIDNKLYITL
jgi:hypothetical protein